MTDLQREIRWEPNEDRMRVRFLLRGDLGAVQFLIQFRTNPTGYPLIDRELAEGRDVGFHSVRPVNGAMHMEECDVLEQGECYYDGSGLQAEELGRLFLKNGEPIVWEWLEDRYKTWLVREA